MLLAITVLVALGGAVILYRSRAPSAMNDVNPGWMSAQWLAEQRGSNAYRG